MLINFKNSFTVAFCNIFAERSLLRVPLHLNHVATLPCKTSAADTFDFQQVIDGVHGHVQAQQNESGIRRSWS